MYFNVFCSSNVLILYIHLSYEVSWKNEGVFTLTNNIEFYNFTARSGIFSVNFEEYLNEVLLPRFTKELRIIHIFTTFIRLLFD